MSFYVSQNTIRNVSFILFLQDIGQIDGVQTCQAFCKDLYQGTCTWFMYDRTTHDCKLFNGSLNDLQTDCREVGYARDPGHGSCDTEFDSSSADGCYVSTTLHTHNQIDHVL